MDAWNIGLVVITMERYFKIVHAVAHRKHYRSWMTKVGVVVPWISGFCTFAIPAYVWTRHMPGRCPDTMALPSTASLMVSRLFACLGKCMCHISLLRVRPTIGFSVRYLRFLLRDTSLRSQSGDLWLTLTTESRPITCVWKRSHNLFGDRSFATAAGPNIGH